MNFDNYHDTTVQLSEDLVNTYNVVREVEKLPSLAALARFLVGHGFEPPKPLRAADLAAVRALRAPLRGIYYLSDEAEAVAVLNRMLRQHRATPHWTCHDGQPWHLHVSSPDAPVADQLGAAAAMGLMVVIRDYGLSRFQVCVGHRCGEVFVDVSRNRSRRYCSPAICGNRAHAAAFRRRRR